MTTRRLLNYLLYVGGFVLAGMAIHACDITWVKYLIMAAALLVAAHSNIDRQP